MIAVEKLDLMINALQLKAYEQQETFAQEMEELERQKQLIMESDLTASQMELALAEINAKIEQKQLDHEIALQTLQKQREVSDC